ncbi:MAG: hypothetical protein ACREFR_00560 [Limisphaerales bacterium]
MRLKNKVHKNKYAAPRAQFATSKMVVTSVTTLLLLVAIGCHRDNVEVYQVSADQDQPQPKSSVPPPNTETLPPGHPAVPMADNPAGQMPPGVMPSDAQNVPPITWTNPVGWTSVPPSEMRVASFKIAGAHGEAAEVSIVPLPGMAGGDFANVNRWRGQVGLPDASDTELQNSAENVEAGGEPASLYDESGQNASNSRFPTRILGAIQHRDGTAWFFKMIGDADLVEQQKPAFIAFLKSLNFGSQPSQPQLPPGHPDISDMAAPQTSGPGAGQPNWTIPAGWQSLPAGQFLVAKFKIASDKGAWANINVSSSAGDGGGLEANVNRWRGQLGLPPVGEIPTITFEVPGGQAQLVELAGKDSQTGQPSEIVGVVVMLPGKTWFYKLMGNPSVVAAQKGAFTEFVKGAQY